MSNIPGYAKNEAGAADVHPLLPLRYLRKVDLEGHITSATIFLIFVVVDFR